MGRMMPPGPGMPPMMPGVPPGKQRPVSMHSHQAYNMNYLYKIKVCKYVVTLLLFGFTFPLI